MRGLIGDLLDTGRIESGTLSVAPEPSELAALVEQARSTFLGGGGRHAVLVDLPAGLPPVMADRRRVVQVLNNLLANAARHAPASTPIRVAAAAEEAHVAVSVSDEGRAVASERLPHLFSRGARVGRGRSLTRPSCVVRRAPRRPSRSVLIPSLSVVHDLDAAFVEERRAVGAARPVAACSRVGVVFGPRSRPRRSGARTVPSDGLARLVWCRLTAALVAGAVRAVHGTRRRCSPSLTCANCGPERAASNPADRGRGSALWPVGRPGWACRKRRVLPPGPNRVAARPRRKGFGTGW